MKQAFKNKLTFIIYIECNIIKAASNVNVNKKKKKMPLSQLTNQTETRICNIQYICKDHRIQNVLTFLSLLGKYFTFKSSHFKVQIPHI